tara:strand:+ start:156 stop:383 length:228 start_codon:yes stop_codon:yes gene_type:complete
LGNHAIHCQYFSQEDLLSAGHLDIRMAMDAAESAIRAFHAGDIIFPDKIVQILTTRLRSGSTACRPRLKATVSAV